MAMIKGKQVIITTEYRGVYHGTIHTLDKKNRDCVLTDANMILRWGTTEGVDQLADTGPTPNSKIASMANEIWLPGLTSVVLCSEEAIEKWTEYKKRG